MTWYEQLLGAGFLFFLIKGIVWLIIFALMYFGVIKKKSKRKANG